jgi:hypothetical protein
VPDFQTTLTIRWAAPDDDAARDDVDRWLSQLTPGVDSVLVTHGDVASDPGTEQDPAFAAWGCPSCGFANEPVTTLCHGCGWDSAL